MENNNNNNNNNANNLNQYIPQFGPKQKELADKITKFIQDNENMPKDELIQKIFELIFANQQFSVPKEVFEPIIKSIIAYAKSQITKHDTTNYVKQDEHKKESDDKGELVEW